MGHLLRPHDHRGRHRHPGRDADLVVLAPGLYVRDTVLRGRSVEHPHGPSGPFPDGPGKSRDSVGPIA
ncbi:hypothetical protein KPATCC21470_0926 [Kitasatospora purpeofusca]